jgi:hypothetical protein
MTAKIIPWLIRVVVRNDLDTHKFFESAEQAYEELGPAVRESWDREMRRLNEVEKNTMTRLEQLYAEALEAEERKPKPNTNAQWELCMILKPGQAEAAVQTARKRAGMRHRRIQGTGGEGNEQKS